MFSFQRMYLLLSVSVNNVNVMCTDVFARAKLVEQAV